MRSTKANSSQSKSRYETLCAKGSSQFSVPSTVLKLETRNLKLCVFQSSARYIYIKPAALDAIRILPMRIVPHGGNLYRAGRAHTGNLDRQAPLLIHVGFDHLGGNAAGKLTVLAAFKQHGHHQAGIAPRGNAHEPGVVLHGVSMAQALRQGVAHGLSAARLAGKINSFQVSAARRAEGSGHI